MARTTVKATSQEFAVNRARSKVGRKNTVISVKLTAAEVIKDRRAKQYDVVFRKRK